MSVTPINISIHALREEGDLTTWEYQQKLKEFLSTPSVRRATAALYQSLLLQLISIHALREEGDNLHI